MTTDEAAAEILRGVIEQRRALRARVEAMRRRGATLAEVGAFLLDDPAFDRFLGKDDGGRTAAEPLPKPKR